MSFDLERFRMYTRFVEERHRIWELRQLGEPPLWTGDAILASKKFTNVFRVLDPGSQFIFELAGLSERDTLMRLFLYRHTGRVEAWQYLASRLGSYPLVVDLERVRTLWQDYRDAGNPIFTGAYLVYPQSSNPGTNKLDSIINLTQRLFTPGAPDDVLPDFLAATTQAERFAALRRNRGVADFMSMQILTDWGYTAFGEDRENEFVVPGPGCRRGVQAITKTPKQADFIRFAREELLASDDCPTLNLGDGMGVRYPSIMDVQNTLCEFSKYVRFVEAGITSKPYTPAHPGPQATPVLPQHWTTTTR
jgi:hypothetical protein